MAEPKVTINPGYGETSELTITGEIDYHSSGELRKRIKEYFERNNKDLRLHLSGVAFIDSTGLSVLLDAVKQAKSIGVGITLVHPNPQLVRVLTVSGFAPFFNIEYDGFVSDIHDDHDDHEHLTDDSLLMETFEAEGKPENIGSLRRSVTRFADALPFTSQELDDIKLAVGEATCNALRYGCPTGKESIHVTCTRQGRRFAVQIRDSGPGFDPVEIPLVNEGELSEGGRGIFFMKCLMDEVNFNFDNGTTVELVKYLPETPSKQT